jgi:hypothetical protein
MRFRRKSHRKSARLFSRSYKRVSRRRSSSSGSGWKGDIGIALGAAGYGAGREWVSQKLSPVTSAVVPVFGAYADEAVLLGLGWALRHGKIPGLNKVPMAREIGTAVMVVEAARIGSGVAGGMIGQSSTTNTAGYVYG